MSAPQQGPDAQELVSKRTKLLVAVLVPIGLLVVVGIVVALALGTRNSGPTDEDVFGLVEEVPGSLRTTLVLDVRIEARKPSREVGDREVYPIVVRKEYVEWGMKYGGFQFGAPYYEDRQVTWVAELLIAKDHFDDWKIVDRKTVEQNVREHKRPIDVPMEEFYGKQDIYKK
jgi:hypothetical protein